MALDDWHDPALSEFAAALHRRWRFAAVITNYVWCSAVLEALPDSIVKLLDTHDVFGGREEHFRELGLQPAWYWTTAAEEARGLQRAHIVLAIQDAEAEVFRSRGHGDVRVIGHLLPLRSRGVRPGRGNAPDAGYLGSGNPFNVSAFVQLRDALRAGKGRRKGGELLLAGVICESVDKPGAISLHRPDRRRGRFLRRGRHCAEPDARGHGAENQVGRGRPSRHAPDCDVGRDGGTASASPGAYVVGAKRGRGVSETDPVE